MIHTSLDKAFENNGITKQDAAPGTVFDPEKHDALMNMPWSEGKQPGTIGAAFKTGYDYRNRAGKGARDSVIFWKNPFQFA
eukprot:gene8257-22720_t